MCIYVHIYRAIAYDPARAQISYAVSPVRI